MYSGYVVVMEKSIENTKEKPPVRGVRGLSLYRSGILANYGCYPIGRITVHLPGGDCTSQLTYVREVAVIAPVRIAGANASIVLTESPGGDIGGAVLVLELLTKYSNGLG